MLAASPVRTGIRQLVPDSHGAALAILFAPTRCSADDGPFGHRGMPLRKLLMDRAPGNQIDLILTHPRHQQALRTMIELIRDLRTC
jgi:hypothetical protein